MRSKRYARGPTPLTHRKRRPSLSRALQKEFPDVEEAVMVNVKRIADMGAYVTVRAPPAAARFLTRGNGPLTPPRLCGSPRPPSPSPHRSSSSTTIRRA